MTRFTVLFFAFLTVLTPFHQVFAETDGNNQAPNYDYIEELRVLRKEIKELRVLVDKLTNKQVENKTEIVENKAEIIASKPKPHSDFDMPSLSIQGFGHVQYDYANDTIRDQPNEDTNHFTNGDLGLLFSSQISKKLSFFNETLFNLNSDGDTGIEVERLLLNYEYADWLNVSVGKGHTPLGYWNQHHYHATWTHTTTDRPLLFQFEEHNGVLPLHYVGIGISGNVGLDFGNVEYSMTLANGRGIDSESIQVINDLNDDKQISFQFTIEPNAIEGFGIGANILYDVIPNNIDVLGRENEIDEVIGGAHLYYTTDPYELIAEYQYIWHDNLISTKSHQGGYLQLAYSFDKIKPYYRFDIMDVDFGDSFYAGLHHFEDTIRHTVGVRYDWFPFAALKLEYRRTDAYSVDSNEISSQISFMY